LRSSTERFWQCLAIVWFSWAQAIAAQGFEQPRAIEQVFPLEGVGLSARAGGMGGAFTAVADGSDILDFNPAGLSRSQGLEFALHHQSWMGTLQRGSAAAIFPFGPFTVGTSFRYLGYGALTQRDESGNIIGSYHPQRIGLSTSLSRSWGRISLGATVRYLRQTLCGASLQAVGGDAGGLLRLTDRLDAGFAYTQFGTTVQTFRTPETYRTGLSYLLPGKGTSSLRVASDFAWEPLGVHRLHLGAEGNLKRLLDLRCGYSFDLSRNPLQGFHGLTMGLGFHYGITRLDYAFVPQGELGSTHQVTLRILPHRAAPSAPTTSPTVPSPTLTSTATPFPTLTSTLSLSGVPPAPSPTATPASTEEDPPSLDLEVHSIVVPTGPDPMSMDGAASQEIESLQAIIEKEPDNTEAWLRLGHLYWKIRDREMAVQCLEQVLRLKPDAQALSDWLTRTKAALASRATPQPTPTAE
jgi:hypothetical protein